MNYYALTSVFFIGLIGGVLLCWGAIGWFLKWNQAAIDRAKREASAAIASREKAT